MNRDMWMNPLSDVMGGWWIWKVSSNGTKVLTTECFENIALMLPFTILLMWTTTELRTERPGFKNIVWSCTKGKRKINQRIAIP